MRMKRKLAVGLGAMVLSGGAALAAGFFPNVPVVGGLPFCYSTVNGVCGGTVPSGAPVLTGVETVVVDTGLPSGQFPQSEAVPTSVLSLPFGTNRLVGGDFNTNLEQRLSTTKGIASLAGLTPTAAVMTADGWWEYSAAGTTTVTIGNNSPEVLPALGTTRALRLARTTNTQGATECIGQTLDNVQAAPLFGNNAVFSFWELNGFGQSAVGGTFQVAIAYSSNGVGAGTQTTLGYAGLVGSRYAIGFNASTFGTGGPTNMQATAPVLGPGTTGTVGANGFVTLTGNSSWTRYAIATPIPAVIPGTGSITTDVSVEICYTPTSASTNTTDWIEIQGLQLEAKPSTVTASSPQGVITPTAFERRPLSVEALIDYSYWYFNYESQTAINQVATCSTISTTVMNCALQFPQPMRITPAVQYTGGFQGFTTTGETAVNACALANMASYAVVPSNSAMMLQCTATTLPAAGSADFLTTLGTSSATGVISASAEP